MIATRRLVAALVLALLGAGVSAVLLAEHRGHTLSAVARICGQGSDSGCEAVARSPWSAPLGIPLAAAGLAFCASLALLLALALADGEAAHRDAAARAALLALGAALGVDLALLALQAFSIGAFCVLCLATYALNGGTLALLWPARRRPLQPLAARAARPLVAGWTLASLAALAAVAAADSALVARQPSATALLGIPGAGSLAEAQERIRALQATLDDPRKLQEYLDAKALRDFQGAPVEEVDLVSAPIQGDPAAPLRVVTYSDFLCPYCRSLAVGLQQFLSMTGGRVSVRFKNYPLDQECNPALAHSTHPGACWLARGAVCAHEQGRFPAYHDKVFSAELVRPDAADVRRLGREAGLDDARLSACLTAPATQARLAADIAEARRIGVQATPTVLIDGKKLPSLDAFFAAIESESARLGLPPLPRAAAR
jgi:protein-disulfide isomerase/uncharacterized membrane protein